MATIQRPPKRGGGKWKWIAILLVILSLVVLLRQGTSTTASLRKLRTPISLQELEAIKGAELKEGDKLFRFEVAFLDGEADHTGAFIIHTKPYWAPIGVDRFHELMDAGFYDGCRFFRVLPDFVVQFGIHSDPEVQKKYEDNPLKDDPVVATNDRGTLSFASIGAETRKTQIFINVNPGGNPFLGTVGYTPFAEVISGMDVVDRLYNEYREKPNQREGLKRGNAYFDEEWPKLSYVVKATEWKG